jgi:hypothetical protein
MPFSAVLWLLGDWFIAVIVLPRAPSVLMAVYGVYYGPSFSERCSPFLCVASDIFELPLALPLKRETVIDYAKKYDN